MKAEELKERAKHELIEYAVNVVYLALVIAGFTIYRRLVLASYDIIYTNYWVAVIEALILGKVIMIGSLFRLGRSLDALPLIFPTIYKTVVFTVFIVAFKVLEHVIRGLWDGGGITAGLVELSQTGKHLLLANVLIVSMALFPYFAIRELERVYGREQLFALFFRRRTSASIPPWKEP